MKIYLIGILITITTFGCTTKTPISKESNSSIEEGISESNLEKIDKIDSLIQQLINNKKTAGFSFGVQVGNAEPIVKVYGKANVANNREVTLSDKFRIASVTKPFTAAAILKLSEAGELSLDDTIDKYFPNYPNGKNISVYQLLSHTSGIPNWWEGELPENVPESFPMCKDPHFYLQNMKKAALYEPGEFYSYSNSGYVLLGEIIEKVSGQSYDDFLKEHVFNPAGMNETEMEYIEKNSESWIDGYALDTSKVVPFVQPDVYHMPYSAGGLRSTASDLLKFVMALNSGKIIRKESLEKMTSYATLKNSKPVHEGVYLAPGSQPKENKEKRGYGLGFNLEEHTSDIVFSHSGGIAGFNSILMHNPSANVTLIFLANTEDGIIPEFKNIHKIALEME